MKQNCRYRVWLWLACALAIPLVLGGVAFADSEDQGNDAAELDEIIVRSTRMDRRIDQVPAAISVVTKDDIQRGRQQIALDESLAAVPGVFIQSRYNSSRDLRIAIRGFGARSSFGIRGVKILVDGIPESLPDGQGQSDAIDLGSTERIEVIRGPTSSLYGNASGGVINITSERGPPIPFVETRLSVGEFDYSQVQFKTGGDTGRWNYLINFSKMDFDGYRAHSHAENTLLNARLVYTIDDESELGLVLNVTDQPVALDPGGIDLAQAEADPTSARQRNVDFDTGEVLDQQRLGLIYKKTFGEHHEIRIRNHYVWRDFANKLPFSGGGATAFERFYVGGGATYTLRSELWGRPNNLIVGTDVDRQDDDRQRYNNDMGILGTLLSDQRELVTNIGLFLQNEMALTDKFALTLGLRYDEVKYEVKDKFLADGDDSATRTLDEVSPMIGLVYSPLDSANFYATISTAFETPTTTELADPLGAGGFNPDLQPQLATNYEVGVRGTLAERNRYELSLFSIDVENELIPFEVGGRDIYENAGKSSRNGVEFSFTSNPVDSLRISFAYTYSDFVFDEFLDDNGNDYAGNRIPGLPENLFRGEVAYTHPSGYYAVVDARTVGEFFANNANTVVVSSSTVVNLRTGLADWNLGNWRLEPFVGVNNLTDESYFSEIRINSFGGRYYEPAPVRHFYGGLGIRYNFGRGQR